jgi:N-acetylglucosaminyldiphosphoundecaprenol N-acetyl-beta-D-mannosaminyltransferase
MPLYPHINLLGYKIFSGDTDLLENGISGVVNTMNPHCYVLARRDDNYKKALLASDLIIPDGVGIRYAAKVINGEKIERLSGSDLHEVIINSLNRSKGSCFYLGSSEATLEKIKESLSREQSGIRVGSYSPPYKDEFSDSDNEMMINAVREFNPDVLFIGMTAPKQEKWVYRNREKLDVPMICSIGAVFDFYAGTVKRSGQIWINSGLEWLPRLLREPGRLWRRNFISTPLFIWYVAVEWVRIRLKRTCPPKLKQRWRA